MRPSFAAALLTIAMLNACTTAPASSTADKTSAPGQKCFFANNVNSFATVDENHVNLKVGVRDVYQLTMFAPCLDIDWANRVVLVPRGGSSICTGLSTAELVAPSTSSGRAQRCLVQSVSYLTPEEVAALPKGQKP